MPLEAILHAHRLLGSGRVVEAEHVLIGLLPGIDAAGVTPLAVATYRLLGQCARQSNRFDDARDRYFRAYELAAELRDPDLASAAVTGLGTVELADDNLPRAAEMFERAEELARMAGPGTGLASTLQIHAELLHRMSDDRAADKYAEALDQPGITPVLRGIILDNLGRELRRQGRVTEAIGRVQESIELLRAAGSEADTGSGTGSGGALDTGFDTAKALINLADLARGVDDDLAGRAFAEAHDLMHRLHARLDIEHYTTRYAGRVAAIEAETRRRAAAGELRPAAHPAFVEAMRGVDSEVSLEIGLVSMLGQRALDEGEEHTIHHRHAEAERSLRLAESLWESLGAHHVLPRVWGALGLLRKNTGDFDEAWTLLMRSREAARAVGNASTEATALTNLCVLADTMRRRIELHPLDLLAQARAVADVAGRIRGLPSDEHTPTFDLGALDSLEGELCLSYGAVELAERYFGRAVAAMERIEATSGGHAVNRNRLAVRLVKLGRLLARQGRTVETDAVRARLRELAAADDDALIRFPVHAGLAQLDLLAGSRTAGVLASLRDSCAAYEELRARRGPAGADDNLAAVLAPPYEVAVELAIELGETAEAFDLLERAKARTLLDALRDHAAEPADGALVGDAASVGGTRSLLAEESALWRELRSLRARRDPTGEPHEHARRFHEVGERAAEVGERLSAVWDRLAAEHPQVRAHRLAESVTSTEVAALLAAHGSTPLVEFFVGERALHAFTVTSGGLSVRAVAATDEPGVAEFLHLLTADADTAAAGADDVADRLVAHPVFARLASVVDEAAGDGPVFVVPHGPLHAAPLHLRADAGIRARTGLLPSASILRSGTVRARAAGPAPTGSAPTGSAPAVGSAPTGSASVAGSVLVAGDPTGDLPFSRAECEHAADRFGAPARYGAQVGEQWLADGLRAGARLVHLACHAEFDRRRPERSGLVLAAEDGRPDLVSLGRLAALNWSGALVVLSACHSGRHDVRHGDELAGLGRTLLAAGATALIASFRPVPDLATALLMTWFHDALATANTPDATTPDVSAALAGAQERMRHATARELVGWAERHRRHGGARALLACQVAAAAHRAAGEVDAYVTWQEHTAALRRDGTDPGDAAWSRSLRQGTAPSYLARPFAAPVHWMSFAVFGTG